MYTIYKYTNKENQKVYIGQTSTTLDQRAQTNGNNYRGSRRFYNAIKKYSWESFVPEVLAITDSIEEANKLEIDYIHQYNSTDDRYGYNIQTGGNNHTVSDETRRIISQKASERYKDKTKNPMYGKKHTDKAKEKQSACKRGENNPMYGTTWTETQRRLCGTKGKTLNISDERRNELRDRMRKLGKETVRPIRCVTEHRDFSSIKEASEYYNIPKSTLVYNLKGYSKLCRGKYKFCYI